MYSPKHARLTLLPEAAIAPPSECPLAGPGVVVIEKNLSDKVLLSIFRYYLDASPRHWPTLVHICRRWRRLVFASQRPLHLRLFCTYGTPVLKCLDCWPTLPIVVQYGGSLELDPPAPEDEDNIVAALKQSDRVISISLTVTNPLLEKLSAIDWPFLELEDLVLSSRDRLLTLPRAFGWGHRLRSLHLTRIAFFALPQLLHSSSNLVDIQLHEVLNPRLFSTEALTDALSGMSQLRSLSLHFLPTHHYIGASLPRSKPIVIHSLTRLDFRGVSEYLEDLAARIDAPHLGDIELTFFNESIPDLPKLSEFIDRIGMHKLHRRADILFSAGAISVSFIQPGAPTCIKLQGLRKPLSTHPSTLARVFTLFSPSLPDLEELRISATRPFISEYSLNNGSWLELFNTLTCVKLFHVAGDISTDISSALQLPDKRGEAVLPAIRKIYISQPGPRHAPLREGVVAFMTSRRLSGHPIAVEYEQLCGTGAFTEQLMLSDDILLNIFRHCLDASPRIWPTLAWVCQSWRRTVFLSPLSLDLRLYCTPGTPVLKNIGFWPELPIILEYGGFPNLDPPVPEDDENIITALKKSGRVRSISLTITSTLFERLSTISEPFTDLEELTLLSGGSMRLTLPGTFRWGPRLRILHSTGIGFPSFPQILSPCLGLVDLRLHDIPRAGYFPPDAFANAVSGMTQLEYISLQFYSFPRHRNFLRLPLPGQRIILPTLTCLKYRGISKYLDSLVARIDAPRLRDIEIVFFSQPTMDASQLGRFIERIETPTLLSHAVVESSAHSISISFPNPSTSTPLRLQISCKQLDWQLSSLAQVCDQFSPLLSRVQNIIIRATRPSSGPDEMDSEQWLELVRPFGGTRDFRVTGELTTAVLCIFGRAGGEHSTLLSSLRRLHIEWPMAMNEQCWDALYSFIASRSLSDRPIQLEVRSYQCHVCHSSFEQQRGLHSHLVDEHTYRIVCSYCSDFKREPGLNYGFLRHLETEHPEDTRNDPLVSNPAASRRLHSSQLECLLYRHTSLLAPGIVAPSTTVTPKSDTVSLLVETSGMVSFPKDT